MTDTETDRTKKKPKRKRSPSPDTRKQIKRKRYNYLNLVSREDYKYLCDLYQSTDMKEKEIRNIQNNIISFLSSL